MSVALHTDHHEMHRLARDVDHVRRLVKDGGAAEDLRLIGVDLFTIGHDIAELRREILADVQRETAEALR